MSIYNSSVKGSNQKTKYHARRAATGSFKDIERFVPSSILYSNQILVRDTMSPHTNLAQNYCLVIGGFETGSG